MGFDEEKSLGKGETGSRAALPLWMDYMKQAHKDLPDSDFPVPDNIVFVNMDAETGTLPSPNTKKVVRQAFIGGQSNFAAKTLSLVFLEEKPGYWRIGRAIKESLIL